MKIKNMLAVLLISGISMLSLYGCSAEETVEPMNIAVVTLNGQNMPQYDENAMDSLIDQAVASDINSTVSLVIADGEPHLAGETICFSTKEANNDNYWKNEKDARKEQINNLLTREKASSPGTDLLNGIRLGARQLQSGENKHKVLAIAHAGINTTSPLPMQSTDITALGEDTVQQLKDAGYLADLSGCEVHWFFLGDVDGDQPALSPEQTISLQTFWESYLTACGAASVTFESTLPSTGQAAEAPSVPVVAAVTTNIDLMTPMSLTTEIVSFQPDSAQLSDKDAARKQLAGIAEAMSASNGQFLLAGSTASAQESPQMSNQQFGLQRAQAVRLLLGEMGVDSSKIVCVGLGDTNTTIRSTTDDQANRTVWLVPMDDPLAAEFQSVGLAE